MILSLANTRVGLTDHHAERVERLVSSPFKTTTAAVAPKRIHSCKTMSVGIRKQTALDF
jgi:hypothetical protein